MSSWHLAFCCITIYAVSEGKIVQGKIGKQVSFSWMFNISRYDAVEILHNGSRIHRFFPINNPSVQRESPDRVSFLIDYATPKNVKVTINILNITENDIGTYRVVQQWNSMDLDVSVYLQTTGINHYTTMVTDRIEKSEEINNSSIMPTTMIEVTEETNHTVTTSLNRKDKTQGTVHYTTIALIQKDDAEGINHYTTAAMTTKADDKEFPSKRQLMYIVLGMGAVLAVSFFACILHKFRICLRVDSESSSSTFVDCNKVAEDENLQVENLPGNYWTIVSNDRGELRTAIETDLGQCCEPPLIQQDVVPSKNELEQSMRADSVKVNEALDGYLNPIHESPVEFDDYIHPVHSDPVNTSFVSMHQSMEF